MYRREAPDESVMQDRSFHLNLNCDGFGIPVVKDLPLWALERIQQEAEAGSVRQSNTEANQNQSSQVWGQEG